MPIWRLQDEDERKLRSIEGLNWIGDSVKEFDGSSTITCSRAAATMIAGAEIELEYVSENLVQWPPNPRIQEFVGLVRDYGTWTVLAYLRSHPAGTPEEFKILLTEGANVAS